MLSNAPIGELENRNFFACNPAIPPAVASQNAKFFPSCVTVEVPICFFLTVRRRVIRICMHKERQPQNSRVDQIGTIGITREMLHLETW